MKPGKGILALIAEPKGKDPESEPESESEYSDEQLTAAADLRAAVAEDSDEALVDAFRALMMACEMD